MNVRAVRVAMAERDMRQYQLAEKLGVSQASISLYLSKKRQPKAPMIKMIERVLKLKVGSLRNGKK